MNSWMMGSSCRTRALARPLRVWIVVVIASAVAACFGGGGIAQAEDFPSGLATDAGRTAYVYDGLSAQADLVAGDALVFRATVRHRGADFGLSQLAGRGNLASTTPTRSLVATEAGGGASLDNLSTGDAARIQNASNKVGLPIAVVGSRAAGTATPGQTGITSSRALTRRFVGNLGTRFPKAHGAWGHHERSIFLLAPWT